MNPEDQPSQTPPNRVEDIQSQTPNPDSGAGGQNQNITPNSTPTGSVQPTPPPSNPVPPSPPVNPTTPPETPLQQPNTQFEPQGPGGGKKAMTAILVVLIVVAVGVGAWYLMK